MKELQRQQILNLQTQVMYLEKAIEILMEHHPRASDKFEKYKRELQDKKAKLDYSGLRINFKKGKENE